MRELWDSPNHRAERILDSTPASLFVFRYDESNFDSHGRPHEYLERLIICRTPTLELCLRVES